jgi:hypothetical protein
MLYEEGVKNFDQFSMRLVKFAEVRFGRGKHASGPFLPLLPQSNPIGRVELQHPTSRISEITSSTTHRHLYSCIQVTMSQEPYERIPRQKRFELNGFIEDAIKVPGGQVHPGDDIAQNEHDK